MSAIKRHLDDILEWCSYNDINPEQYEMWELEEMYQRSMKRMVYEEDQEAMGDFERGN